MAYTIKTEFVEVQKDTKIYSILSAPKNGSPTPNEKNDLTVVFLHFWGGSSSTWSRVISSVGNVHPALALDFRGWGQSTGPDEPEAYSITHLADDVEFVIKHHNLRQFVIVGHSMGAKVAQVVAGRNRLDGLCGLFLVAPAPPTPLALSPDMREQQIHAYDARESAEFVTRNVLSAGALSDEATNAVVQDMLAGNKWARAAWPAYAMAENVQDLASRISQPVLVVAAEKDVVEPLERVEVEVCKNIRTATLKVLPESGHLIPLEAPEELNAHLLSFIKTLG